MIFDNTAILNLKLLVRDRLSEKRYTHTLGVEKLARHLGQLLIPEKVDELSVAALLHDIAKELTYDEHLQLLKDSFVKYTDEDLSTKPALHSIAALPLVERDFKEFATKDVCSAIANHTLGASGMSIFDEIIFISDYAEEGRTYRTCVDVRNYLMENVRRENSSYDNLFALHTAALNATRSTIDALKNRNENINSRTLQTQQYLEDIISQ